MTNAPRTSTSFNFWHKYHVLHVKTVLKFCFSPSEYDRHIATRRGMAAAYLDPNLNHTAGSGAKSRLSMERSPGAMERVLKVCHYFESNNEPSNWIMNIRHGDATDVRVSQVKIQAF